ncbi:hypothetical protein MIR68_003521 [Amoeboaphelidium protococcarum]|nr:hypothetical protein MIR68_003521 [Amoeboaphelidium protococcarum]
MFTDQYGDPNGSSVSGGYTPQQSRPQFEEAARAHYRYEKAHIPKRPYMPSTAASHRRVPWTDQEFRALYRGAMKYLKTSKTPWADIKKDLEFSQDLINRSTVALKDMYRNEYNARLKIWPQTEMEQFNIMVKLQD